MKTLELPQTQRSTYAHTDAQLLLPSDDDVGGYEADGYYISKPGVIPDELIGAIAAKLARSPAIRLPNADPDFSDPSVFPEI